MRVSNTAVNIVLWPPSECPMQPIRSASTVSMACSTSIARMLSEIAFIDPLM